MLHTKQKNPPAPRCFAFPLIKGDRKNNTNRGIFAFTLVELIVVVTILAILATIGFVSYSSYLTGVRDTNRIAQMTSLSDGLNLYSTTNDLPIPEDNVEILANTNLIAYQGYAGANILETINFDKGGVDPKDNTYFSYYLTRDRRYFQMMGFLEESADLTTSNSLISKTQAVSYQDRIPTVSGKKLGILTDLDNTPIQDLGDDLDIAINTVDYKSYLSNDVIITGSGGSLLSAAAVSHDFFSQYDTSLVTHFDFDNGSLEDSSVSELSATIVGDAKLDEVKGEEAAYFPYTGSDHLDIGAPTILSSGLTDFSISVWTKLNVDISSDGGTNYHILGNETYLSMGFETRIGHSTSPGRLELRTSQSGSFSQTLSNQNEYPNDQKWHHLVFIKDGISGKIYLNGLEVSGYASAQAMQNYATSTNNFAIGASYVGHTGQNFNGHLDDVRIYNRPISAGEVMNLYLKEKKID